MLRALSSGICRWVKPKAVANLAFPRSYSHRNTASQNPSSLAPNVARSIHHQEKCPSLLLVRVSQAQNRTMRWHAPMTHSIDTIKLSRGLQVWQCSHLSLPLRMVYARPNSNDMVPSFRKGMPNHQKIGVMEMEIVENYLSFSNASKSRKKKTTSWSRSQLIKSWMSKRPYSAKLLKRTLNLKISSQ